MRARAALPPLAALLRAAAAGGDAAPCTPCNSGACVPCKGCVNKARDAPCPTCTGGTCADCWADPAGGQPCLGPSRQYCCACWRLSGPQCSGVVPAPVPGPPGPPQPPAPVPPAPPPAPRPPSAGRYKTAHATIASVPGLTQPGSHAAEIAYPTSGAAGETFPFIAFAHGLGAGGSKTWYSYSVDMTTLASYGFIVVAPQSCPTTFCDYPYGNSPDQLATIAAARANPSLHPALAAADFSKVGVQGHSMGAMATVKSASEAAAHGVSAAVAQHPCGVAAAEVAAVTIPIMYTSGSADPTCAESVSVNAYAESTAESTVLFSIAKAVHNEPCVRTSREDAPAAKFMACHLRGEYCDEVYGASGRAICGQPFTLAHCEVKGAAPAPPPGNRTAPGRR